MSILKKIEKQIDEKLRSAFSSPQSGTQEREGIEIYRAVLDDVIARIQPSARGKRTFPFNHVVVKLSALTDERRALYAALFGDAQQLLEDVRGALKEAGANPPGDLHVESQIEAAELPGGYHIAFGRKEAATAEAPAAQLPPAKARLTVLQGAAETGAYDLCEARINVGRMAEVVDDQQRLIRRNNIVFTDAAEGPNATVSRAHAHISWDGASGSYRLYDDGSAYGTSIFRDGSLLQVPAGAARGTALRNGDEVYAGQARIRFELE